MIVIISIKDLLVSFSLTDCTLQDYMHILYLEDQNADLWRLCVFVFVFVGGGGGGGEPSSCTPPLTITLWRLGKKVFYFFKCSENFLCFHRMLLDGFSFKQSARE